MYIPRHFNVTDMEEIREFIQANSFGTIVTIDGGKPIATHIPLQLREMDDATYITGHFAYANPQWKTFKTCDHALIIFQGPHAYVSSSWYDHENVSTWNYQAVHIYGNAVILEQEELKEDLRLLMEKYEKDRENPILWSTLSPRLLESQIKGIVGFKVKVEEIQAAYKLSQNRNKGDYENIIEQLQKEEEVLSHQVAEAMKKRWKAHVSKRS